MGKVTDGSVSTNPQVADLRLTKMLSGPFRSILPFGRFCFFGLEQNQVNGNIVDID
jgi:hypothetical protein